MSSDLPELRASHEDRDRVVDTLRTAGGDGQLAAEELDARGERGLSARTQGELTALVADLSAAVCWVATSRPATPRHGPRSAAAA